MGCAAGCLNHTLLAALGVSALIAASPTGFRLLQYAGAAYLCWLGWQALKSHGARLGARRADGQPLPAAARFGSYFRRGLIANAINPKVGLFFLALLPQFVEAGRRAAGGADRRTRYRCSRWWRRWCSAPSPWQPAGSAPGCNAVRRLRAGWIAPPACCSSAWAYASRWPIFRHHTERARCLARYRLRPCRFIRPSPACARHSMPSAARDAASPSSPPWATCTRDTRL